MTSLFPYTPSPVHLSGSDMRFLFKQMSVMGRVWSHPSLTHHHLDSHLSFKVVWQKSDCVKSLAGRQTHIIHFLFPAWDSLRNLISWGPLFQYPESWREGASVSFMYSHSCKTYSPTTSGFIFMFERLPLSPTHCILTPHCVWGCCFSRRAASQSAHVLSFSLSPPFFLSLSPLFLSLPSLSVLAVLELAL